MAEAQGRPGPDRESLIRVAKSRAESRRVASPSRFSNPESAIFLYPTSPNTSIPDGKGCNHYRFSPLLYLFPQSFLNSFEVTYRSHRIFLRRFPPSVTPNTELEAFSSLSTPLVVGDSETVLQDVQPFITDPPADGNVTLAATDTP